MKSIDLNLLVALDALLDTGSVSLAAQRMHLSTPAMSHTLARIRDALGDPVLVRAGRKLVPTPRALALREPLHRWVADAQGLVAPPDGLELRSVQREFVLRAPDGMAIIYGATLLAALQQTLPLARLRFVPESDSDMLALREGRIDLDIGSVNDHGPEILSALLLEQHIVGAVRLGHPLLTGSVTLKRFVAQAHVAIAQRARLREPVDQVLADAGQPTRRTLLTVPSAYGALMAAAMSPLVACVPEPLARAVAPELGLALFKVPLALPPERVVQAWHPRMDADAAHRCLRQCVAALSPMTHRPPRLEPPALPAQPAPPEPPAQPTPP